MFLFNLFTTDDRVECNIKRINKNKIEPELNILILEYKYANKLSNKDKIIKIAIEHEFDNHMYLGVQLVKVNNTFEIIS